MTTYNGQALFDSGPHRFHVGGLTLRTAEQPGISTDGTHLIAQGREGRPITQTGSLLADDVKDVTKLIAAIEHQIDGIARVLIDGHGRTWKNVVMLRFAPDPLTAVGPRVRVDYIIDYLQVKP